MNRAKTVEPTFRLACVIALVVPAYVSAQDLTPRTYWPAPKGTKVLVLGYAYQSGDIITDPSLPISGVDSRINAGVIAYLQTISLLGRTSNLQVELPYVDGRTTGNCWMCLAGAISAASATSRRRCRSISSGRPP